MIISPQKIIEQLHLQPHPEGGYYKETYRASLQVGPDNFTGMRNISTGIYFLLMKGNFSAFHRIKSDEMWHFYKGNPLNVYVIYSDGRLEIIKLGMELDKGERPQAVVPAGCWFASKVAGAGKFSLVGCTVSPGFDFQDFEMAERKKLTEEFPQHQRIIHDLTREAVP